MDIDRFLQPGETVLATADVHDETAARFVDAARAAATLHATDRRVVIASAPGGSVIGYLHPLIVGHAVADDGRRLVIATHDGAQLPFSGSADDLRRIAATLDERAGAPAELARTVVLDAAGVRACGYCALQLDRAYPFCPACSCVFAGDVSTAAEVPDPVELGTATVSLD